MVCLHSKTAQCNPVLEMDCPYNPNPNSYKYKYLSKKQPPLPKDQLNVPNEKVPKGVKDPHSSTFGKEAGISDEAYEDALLMAELSPKMKKKGPDWIENYTLQIFAHLCTVADGLKRPYIEGVSNLDLKSIQAVQNKTYSYHDVLKEKQEPSVENAPYSPKLKRSYSQKIDPFQNENGFYDYDETLLKGDKSYSFGILSNVVHVLFGKNMSDPKKDQRTIKQCEDELSNEKFKWKTLTKHYEKPFLDKMDHVFIQTDELIKARKKGQRALFFQRITFYASLIIAGVGKFIQSRTMVVAGLVASAACFLFMTINYGIRSFKLSEKEMNLKTSVDTVYKKASVYRKPEASKLSTKLENLGHFV